MTGPDHKKRSMSRWRVSPASAEVYVFATLFVALAALIRWGLGLIDPGTQPFSTFYPAVLFASLVGGLGAGIFAAVVAGILGCWAFMPPSMVLVRLTQDQEINLLVYVFGASLIVWGADHYRRITKHFEQEEALRKLAMEELGHRLKNKLATIQSVVSYQLRDKPELRDAIMGRLVSLSATDSLILEAQGKGAELRDILSAELGPYELSRVAMAGPAVWLSPKLALMIAMSVHELVTNAAKYGALSIDPGSLSIRWSLFANHLQLEWCESGGPVVSAPDHQGFGLRLLSRALEQFSGTVEMIFEPSGLFCVMSATIPENSLPASRVTAPHGTGKVAQG